MTRIKAAALCCGLFFATAAAGKDILPESGPVGATAKRTLMVDGVIVGNRVVVVGDRGYVL